MKNLIIVIFSFLSLTVNAYMTQTYNWGESVDVAYQDEIHFVFNSNEHLANDLEVLVESYGSFECEAWIEQLGEGEILIAVAWGPGSDLSGCTLRLQTVDGYSLGTSDIYMSY